MAAGATDIGTSSTLTFSGFTADLVSIDWAGIERPSIKTSHMGTGSADTFTAGELYDPGEVTAEVHFKSTEKPPLNGATATLTVTIRAAIDGTTWEGDAFLTGFQFGVPFEDLMTATATFKMSGEITVT